MREPHNPQLYAAERVRARNTYTDPLQYPRFDDLSSLMFEVESTELTLATYVKRHEHECDVSHRCGCMQLCDYVQAWRDAALELAAAAELAEGLACAAKVSPDQPARTACEAPRRASRH
jgi:hypothetical protein